MCDSQPPFPETPCSSLKETQEDFACLSQDPPKTHGSSLPDKTSGQGHRGQAARLPLLFPWTHRFLLACLSHCRLWKVGPLTTTLPTPAAAADFGPDCLFRLTVSPVPSSSMPCLPGCLVPAGSAPLSGAPVAACCLLVLLDTTPASVAFVWSFLKKWTCHANPLPVWVPCLQRGPDTPSQNMLLWQEDYLGLKATERTRTQEGLSALLLSA